jgi:hypothetical protein
MKVLVALALFAPLAALGQATKVFPPVTSTGATVPRSYVDHFGDSLSAKDFGARCDDATDDSTALQSAITKTIAAGKWLELPAGICRFATSLNVYSGQNGARIRGQGGQGATLSILRYTGTGSALVANNGSGSLHVYNLMLRDFMVIPGPSSNAAAGFDGTGVSEAELRNVAFATYLGKTFTYGLKCTGCDIMDLNHILIAGTSGTPLGTGMYFYGNNNNAIWIHNGDFYSVSGSMLKFDGVGGHIVIRDNWIESPDIAVDFDDSANSIGYNPVEIAGNRILINTSPANGLALRVNQTTGRAISLKNVWFHHNSYFCASGLCSAAYAIKYLAGGTSGTTSLFVDHNSMTGATSGIVTANNGGSNILYVKLQSNYSYTSGGAEHATPLSLGGSSAWSSIKESDSGYVDLAGSGNGLRVVDGSGTQKALISTAGVITHAGQVCNGSSYCGQATLSAGAASIAVASGCKAQCTDTTAAAAVKCSVSGSTLTIGGTGSDVINWVCF